MIRRPPRSTRTDPLFPYPTLFRSWGGFAVDNPTLNRFYSLHYLLPFVIVGVVVLHLVALHRFGSNNPLGIDVKSAKDQIPFHPYYTVRSEEHTSELQSLMRISYAVLCLKKKKKQTRKKTAK